MMTPADQYARDVLSGKILTCELTKKAVQRYVADLDRQGTKKFPFHFDQSAAQRFIDFAQLCHHWKGQWANTPIILEPWQHFIYWNLYGWKRKDGTRRFRRSYLDMARKNAKTTMKSIRALYHITLDNEVGAQVYVGATKEEQATILVNDAGRIVEATPYFRGQFNLFKYKESIKRVVYPSTNSFIAPLGRDSNTQDGFDPSMGIMDEYHAHPTDGVLNVIESGMGARKQPSLDIITTAGFNKQFPCYSVTRKNAISVLNGDITDEDLFAMIFTLDDEEEWDDVSKLSKANPNWNVSVNGEYIESRLNDAKNKGGDKEVDFKTKNGNIWTDAAKTWIPSDLWKSLKADISPDFLRGRKCYGGLDLASTKDTSALILLFPLDDGKFYLKTHFFVPLDTARQRSKEDKVPYETWIRDGYMIGTEGNVTDYRYIETTYNDLNDLFKIVSTAYDRHNSSQLVINLREAEYQMTPMSQWTTVMSAPTKEFERLIFDKKLLHDGNPVMAWQMGNVALKMDSNENYKPDKKKSQDKIDGPVAGVMAVGEWMTFKDGKTIEIPDDGLDYIEL